MSQFSQLSISLSIHWPSLPVIHPPPSLPQLPVPQQPNLLLGDFRDKSPFLLFLPAPDTKQTWRQCSRKSVADIIYPKSGFGHSVASGPSPREVGHVGGLAASSSLHTNIHRFWFHFVVRTSPDLLRPKQTRVALCYCGYKPARAQNIPEKFK